DEALALLNGGSTRETMAAAGLAFSAAHRGAAVRMAEAVRALRPR
ncbi:MAG: hypothetical protein RL227_1968, partial [Pseudomonadota bacterium]